MSETFTVGIVGLGAIGMQLARALDAGVPGLKLAAVAVRDAEKARAAMKGFRDRPLILDIAKLPRECDIIVEAAPASVFAEVAQAAVESGCIFVPSSCGQLLSHMALVERAKETGARIIVPTGALLGLDAVRAAAEGEVHSVTIRSAKPPRGLAGAPFLVANGIDVEAVTERTRIFAGNVFDAVEGFPANVNVAAALALAGIGPERTQVEVWADPALDRNTHTIVVEAASARLTMTIENVPSEENPRTGKITALSILACLRGLVNPLKVGS